MNEDQVNDRTRAARASFFGALLAGVLACLTVTALTGCATTTAGGTVGADRSQLLLISSEELNQLAAQSYDKLKSEASNKGVLNPDAAMLQRVRTISGRLEAQTNVFRKDAPGWQWEVNTIKSDELNAFCLPGGKIMVYSGIITKLDLTDAELANVLGHEIAHALREHVREQMSQALVAQGVIGAGAAIFGLGGTSTKAANVGYQVLLATRFSRTDESEADQIGLELAARAGYDPRAGITLWQKMTNANQGAKPPEFLSSHPADATRIQRIQNLLPKVIPLYDATR
ncbi:MAG: M48 family metallopeptidase [Gammaproteobacteria bacterium]|nr:M48 family metallopeptidase [Gammaproteobacteria bacterium]MBT8110576.1 M48 family metallopeptidase [Gammaproteobacteria bacterium]NNL45276.1 M48 family metallopeptidase [Woeseiaceae bacterium]